MNIVNQHIYINYGSVVKDTPLSSSFFKQNISYQIDCLLNLVKHLNRVYLYKNYYTFIYDIYINVQIIVIY